MRIARTTALLTCVALAAGCGAASAKRKPPKPIQPVSASSADWKVAVTSRDMDRIRNWRSAFVKALDQARAKGNAPSMAREPVLLDPDASIGGAAPPPGVYRCRTVKIGGNTGPAYVVYPQTGCAVTDEGEVKGFANAGGMQRAAGLIFKGDDKRAIFLGTMMVGDERRAIDYGRDAMRDMAGAVEQIGPKRWRLILPYPSFGSTMDVIELIPVTPV
jgi:Domain of unknown function (DUF4893)